MVVQHGEKERLPGDPGLTEVGHRQARIAAHWLARRHPVALWSSPMRRAVETALPIAQEVGLDVVTDPRLRERMNWAEPVVESIEEFLADWQRASAERLYRPRSGDSSLESAARFLAALKDLAAVSPNGTAFVVTHGGVTTDALRNLLGDAGLRARAPSLIEDGIPSCAITSLLSTPAGWSVESIAMTDHLPPCVGDPQARS